MKVELTTKAVPKTEFHGRPLSAEAKAIIEWRKNRTDKNLMLTYDTEEEARKRHGTVAMIIKRKMVTACRAKRVHNVIWIWREDNNNE